jgi:putative membrane protein
MMNRRIMMAGMAGAVIPAALLTLRGGTAKAATSNASPALTSYTQQTLLISSVSRLASELALERGTNPKVREFAGLELAEQTTIEQILENNPNAAPVALDPQNQAMLNNLQSLPIGPQFDEAYLSAEISGHESILAVQEAFLSSNPDISADPVHVAMFITTFTFEHLSLLNFVQATL